MRTRGGLIARSRPTRLTQARILNKVEAGSWRSRRDLSTARFCHLPRLGGRTIGSTSDSGSDYPGSSPGLPAKQERSFDSLRSLRISPAGSRYAHARKTAQVRAQASQPNKSGPSTRYARSGFRLRAPATLTPARQLKFESRPPSQTRAVLRLATLAQDFACGLPLRSRPRKTAQVRVQASQPNFLSAHARR